jgi:hypothetical protein
MGESDLGPGDWDLTDRVVLVLVIVIVIVLVSVIDRLHASVGFRQGDQEQDNKPSGLKTRSQSPGPRSDYEYDYEHDYDDEHEHEQERRLSIFE